MMSLRDNNIVGFPGVLGNLFLSLGVRHAGTECDAAEEAQPVAAASSRNDAIITAVRL